MATGAWEQQPTSVLCAILHTDTTTIAWAFGLRNLIIPGEVIGLSGMPFAHARNAAAMRCLDMGAEWLFFLDSDVIPPRDAIIRLIAHEQPIVSGIYCRRSPPHAIPVMLKDKQWITRYPPNRLIEVDLVGAGCLLIHRSVLQQLPPQRPGQHWFDWRVDMKGTPEFKDRDDECASEDFTFCIHARKNGYKVLVDTSIMCRHVGYAEAALGSFNPLNFTSHT